MLVPVAEEKPEKQPISFEGAPRNVLWFFYIGHVPGHLPFETHGENLINEDSLYLPASVDDP